MLKELLKKEGAKLKRCSSESELWALNVSWFPILKGLWSLVGFAGCQLLRWSSSGPEFEQQSFSDLDSWCASAGHWSGAALDHRFNSQFVLFGAFIPVQSWGGYFRTGFWGSMVPCLVRWCLVFARAVRGVSSAPVIPISAADFKELSCFFACCFYCCRLSVSFFFSNC